MAKSEDTKLGSDYKIIHDTIHGTIKLEQPFLTLLETPELQRLNNIHQLGLAYLVFPGANHSRLEHSLGTYHVSVRMSHALGLSEAECKLVSTAALLHDLGHGPFSHTLEYLINNRLDLDHMDLTREIILGEYSVLDETKEKILRPGKKIFEILNDYDIDPESVANLICSDPIDVEGTLPIVEELPVHGYQQFFNTKKYLFQIIHSSIDADQIDYLLRDSHYTGVAHGVLDVDRLIQTIELFNNDLVVNKNGLSAVEGMLVARTLMYSSVYFHKTVRIAELMLTRAIERLETEQLRRLITSTDLEVISELKRLGGLQRELITLLLYRHLFKRAYYLPPTELEDDKRESILKLEDPEKRLPLEDTLADRAGVPEGHVIIDAPVKELKLSEPRIHKTDIKILDKTVKPLSKYTPIASALKIRNIPEWAVMVATDKKYVEQVSKAVDRVLFG
jgi:HD superfamily phosphohydrolase